MKKIVLLVCFVMQSVTFINAQNYIKNGTFASKEWNEKAKLDLPVDWNLEGNAIDKDGTWILQLKGDWLPENGNYGTDHTVYIWGGNPFSFKLNQKIDDLPKGVYKLSAWSAGTGADTYELYLQNGEEMQKVYLPESAGFVKTTIDNITIKSGQSIVGVSVNCKSNSNWFHVGNVELIKTGDIVGIEDVTKDNVLINQQNSFIELTSQDIIKSVKVISANGILVYASSANKSSVNIPINWGKGVYLLIINSEAGIICRKIIV